MSTSVKLEKLRSLLENVKLEDDDQRDKFRCQLDPLISDWIDELPDLRDIFQAHEIEWLLQDSIRDNDDEDRNEGERFIQFVARSGYRDEPKSDESGRPLRRRTTPVHHAAAYIKSNEEIFDMLFDVYDRYDVNYVDEDGLSHFHIACEFGCDYAVEKFLELGQDPDHLVPATGNSSLHLAVQYEHKKVVELLLRNGADPNLFNNIGLTPLRIICQRDDDDDGLAELFFKIGNKLQINAQDKNRNTLLHAAIYRGHVNLIELLLRNGADPNPINKNGDTPLHILCRRVRKEGLLQLFFEICGDIGKTVRVDVFDQHGATPLQMAYCNSDEEAIKLLLINGADPNSTNEHGFTPLHVLSMNNYDEAVVKLFFEMNDEMKQKVEVDAKDNFGRTPLQWAVANISPNKVDILLERGADLSTFVFPTEDYFGAKLEQGLCENWMVFKLRIAFGIMRIIESLEKGGYELFQSDAISIMKLFATYELFKKSRDFEIFWTKNEKYTEKAKKIMIIPNLSTYDLIQLRPWEAEKQLLHADYFQIVRSRRLFRLPKRVYREVCVAHMCEIISRRFFQFWALGCFYELVHFRLPIRCCDMIIEELLNEDLYNICLAATGQRREDDEKKSTTNVMIRPLKRARFKMCRSA
uniref:Uncharacterized protein n=2 Tax=Trichogramma kaykai TaxID=54128 RepID=A0ABD2VRR7_9HYME